MDPIKLLKGKKILVVDDEQDVLDQLIELLDMSKLDTASSFDEGKRLLEAQPYHIAILDIMGVKGFELLEIAKKQKIPTLMLTAHSLSEESLMKSAEEGASYYAPKEEMHRIDDFVADVLQASEKHKNPWVKWLERLGGFYDRRFGGRDWREKEKAFWRERTKTFD